MDHIAELIRTRRSVRTFDGGALTAAEREQLLDFCRQIENPYQIPVQFQLLDAQRDRLSSSVITGATDYVAARVRRVPHAEAAFGYSFETLVLYAQSLGLGTTWLGGTFDRPAFQQAIRLGAEEMMPCVSPLGRPAAKMSLRETVMRKGVRADSRQDFTALFFAGDFTTPLTPEQAGPLLGPLEAVRWAPSAVNKQPWRAVVTADAVHFYEKRHRGFTGDATGDLQMIDLGIALCHFALTAQEAGLALRFQLDDPQLSPPADTVYIASYQRIDAC